MPNISKAPGREQVISKDGLMSANWLRYLEELQRAVETAGAATKSGLIPATQAGLANLKLDSTQSGARVNVTDFNHILEWDGKKFSFAAGDEGGGYIRAFLSAPLTEGWAECDGTKTTRLLADGTVEDVQLPNLKDTSAYLKFGQMAAPDVLPAIAPTFSGDEIIPRGDNSIPLLTMNSYTPVGTIGQITPAGTLSGYTPAGTISQITPAGSVTVNNTATAAVLVTTSGAVQVAAQAHTHTASFAGTPTTPTFTGTPASITFTGTPVTPVFTGTPAVLTGKVSAPVFTGKRQAITGTISPDAEPTHIVLKAYYRR